MDQVAVESGLFSGDCELPGTILFLETHRRGGTPRVEGALRLRLLTEDSETGSSRVSDIGYDRHKGGKESTNGICHLRRRDSPPPFVVYNSSLEIIHAEVATISSM